MSKMGKRTFKNQYNQDQTKESDLLERKVVLATIDTESELDDISLLSPDEIPPKGQWLVYALKCSDGSLYTGVTNDLKQRLKMHAAGKGSKYIRQKQSFALYGYILFQDKVTAMKEEYRIKQLTKVQKIVLFSKTPMSDIAKDVARERKLKVKDIEIDKVMEPKDFLGLPTIKGPG